MSGQTRKPTRGRSKSIGPTSSDVAELAGVSRSTVSRTFTPNTSVDPSTKARVMQVAQQLGYAPHQAARNLISGRSNTIGLVMASLSNPFYDLVLEGFLEHFQRHNVRVMCFLAPTLDDVELGIRSMLQHNVDAMIVAASGVTSEAVTDCRRNGIPVILFNRSISSEIVPSVQTDNIGGAKMMAEFLVRGGHSRIAYVNGLEMSSTNRDRLLGFTEGLAGMGVEPPIQEYGDFSYEGGREAAKRLMMSASPPDAIFCANDVMALGVLDCLKNELHISVPDSVSVTGFDDIPMAGWSSFNLTTVRQRRTRMIAAAIDLLDRLLDGQKVEVPAVLIEGRLILRGSARLPSSLLS